MKLKSLFLASLAAMAMASCSNEVEGVDNKGNADAAKDAYIQFSIGFPTASSTRAADAEGEDYEQAIQDVSVKVVYDDGTAVPALFNFSKEDFTQAGNTYTLSKEKAMLVSAGSAKVYVSINGGASSADNLTATKNAEDGIDGLLNNIAKTENFLMSGSASKVIEAGITNDITVKVNRVAAKIAETSAKTSEKYKFATTTYNVNGDVISYVKEDISIDLTEYSLLNLNKTSYIFQQATYFVSGTDNYFQYFTATGNTGYNYTASKEIGNSKTYCLENSTAIPTSIVYKAVINDGTTAHDYYTMDKVINNVKTRVLYKSFEALNNDNSKVFTDVHQMNGSENYDAFLAVGVTKYTNGVCYYVREIDDLLGIARNNYYKLNVSQITGIGSAVVDPGTETNLTYLLLTVQVQPWTVILKDIELN